MKIKKFKPTNPYDDKFYEGQTSASFRSAEIYAQHLHKFAQPKSVVDFGCGRGTWLRAFGLLGATRLLGFDGEWNSQEMMEDCAISFAPVDLNKPLLCRERFDLAVSLEVAEHLIPEAADIIVQNLTNASDLVLFSAAYPGQGGTNHINEQPPSYWAEKFLNQDFQPFDVFRPELWGNNHIEFWYRQNSFIYAKAATPAFINLLEHGLKPIASTGFMDCIHPEMHAMTVRRVKLGYRAKNLARTLTTPKRILSIITKWRPQKRL